MIAPSSGPNPSLSGDKLPASTGKNVGMVEYRTSAHAVLDIKCHFVWITKYRYKILRGRVAERARDLLRQICQARETVIIPGAVALDHIHICWYRRRRTWHRPIGAVPQGPSEPDSTGLSRYSSTYSQSGDAGCWRNQLVCPGRVRRRTPAHRLDEFPPAIPQSGGSHQSLSPLYR
jgi:hypothetical protein